MSVCHVKRVHKSAVFSKTKQFRAMASIDDQHKSYTGFKKMTLSDS